MKKLLTVKDICELLQITKSTVYDWVHRGYLPHIVLKSSGKYSLIRFEQDEIEKWWKLRKRETLRNTRLDRTMESGELENYEATCQERR